MDFNSDIKTIIDYAHYWNWAQDWILLQKIYNEYPDSYSLFTPFAYSYLEELIRSTTSEYGIEIVDKNGNPIKRKVGMALISLAKKENSENIDYLNKLDEISYYFKESTCFDSGDNRNSVDHGYMHPINWTKESFEKLIHDISKISPFSKF